MFFGRRWFFAAWLALTAGSAVGGWFFGRGEFSTKETPDRETRTTRSRRIDSVFAADSPKGEWTERVKKATPADFPRLLEEWRGLFPENEDGTEGQHEHALHWLLAQWLVHDREGFLKTVTAEDFDESYWAAQVIVQLNPNLAAELILGKTALKADEFLVNNLTDELAKCQPLHYLELNPDGTKDFTPEDHRFENGWGFAIEALSKTDPLAAANACLRLKEDPPGDSCLQSLLDSFENWNQGDPSLKEWVNQIEDPKIRDLAQHARLIALAEKDPHAAVEELYSTPLRIDLGLRSNAPREILTQLAKQDLPSALRLIRETDSLFPLTRPEPPDPFAPSDESSKPPENPLAAMAHWSDTSEDNWVRNTILNEAAAHLSKNPEELIAALHKLRTEMGGDSPWQRKIEAELVRGACGNLSVESCLSAAHLWADELNGGRDDETFQSLAARAVATDPDRAEAALDSLPESARASFAAEIVKRFPPEKTERRLNLFDQLTPAQWDKTLGESLGTHAADYADAIAALPGSTTSGAREAFMKKWVEQDPEAAARWYASLPHDEAAGPAALGLFNGWVDFDRSSAVTWAESLPAGLAHQAVALDVVRAMAWRNPAEAWRWAASITNPKVRAWAYNTLSVTRKDGPEAFRKEHEAVLRAADME